MASAPSRTRSYTICRHDGHCPIFKLRLRASCSVTSDLFWRQLALNLISWRFTQDISPALDSDGPVALAHALSLRLDIFVGPPAGHVAAVVQRRAGALIPAFRLCSKQVSFQPPYGRERRHVSCVGVARFGPKTLRVLGPSIARCQLRLVPGRLCSN